MTDLRDERGGYNWWASFARAHPEIEDALIEGAVIAQREGATPLGQATAAWSQALVPAATRRITVTAPDGSKHDVVVPVNIPADGAAVEVNGVKGILFEDNEDTANAEENEVEVEAAINRAVSMNVTPIRYNGVQTLYGFTLTNALRDEILEAFECVEDDEAAREFIIRRILPQFIAAIVLGIARTEGEG